MSCANRFDPTVSRGVAIKAVIARDSTPPGLVVTELPYPHLAENEVVVRVHAAGFTRGELEWPGTWTDRGGNARTRPVPGHEMSGVVVEIGYGATGFAVGHRVAGLCDWTRNGTLAEYVAVETRNLAVLPPNVDFVTAAALPISGLTAWQALFDHARLSTGQRVLINGAAGAVGSLAVQLAAGAGADVTATGRATDRERVLECGAGTFLDVRDDAASALSALDQFDVALDVLGGDVLERTVPLVRPGGTLVSVAGHAARPVVNGRMIFFVVEADRTTLARLVEQTRLGALAPKVDRVCELDEAPTAFASPGRTIVRVADPA